MSVADKTYTERDGSEITSYATFAVEYRDSSHRYWLHVDGERTAAISVTSALKVLDKPALIAWAERCGIEGTALAIERGLVEPGSVWMHPDHLVPIVRDNKLGADAKRDAGADRGTAVHEVLRAYCTDGTIPNVGDFPGEVRGYVSAACSWLLAVQPQPLLVEQIVGSPTHGFAGRLDLIAVVDGRTVVVDFKTNPGGRIYDEAHVQTAAYLGALPECAIDEVDGAIIVAFGEEGTFEQLPCEAEFADFLSVLDTCRRMARVRSGRQARERDARKATA